MRYKANALVFNHVTLRNRQEISTTIAERSGIHAPIAEQRFERTRKVSRILLERYPTPHNGVISRTQGEKGLARTWVTKFDKAHKNTTMSSKTIPTRYSRRSFMRARMVLEALRRALVGPWPRESISQLSGWWTKEMPSAPFRTGRGREAYGCRISLF